MAIGKSDISQLNRDDVVAPDGFFRTLGSN
jgi:hypothetical protein